MNERPIPRRQALRIGSAAAMAAMSLAARAQDFPHKSIRMVAPFPAGGVVDQVARMISDDLASALGQPVVVEALPGAGGVVGAQAVVRANPDGHTWLLATPNLISAPHLQTTSYDAVKDFAGVAQVARDWSLAVVPSTSTARSLADLIRIAKSKPGALNYLSAGNGSSTHLNTELFMVSAGISMTAVLYKGLPPGMQDMAAGLLDFGITSPQLALPLIKAGKLRAIAVSTTARHPDFPEVMTYEEQGFADALLSGWYMVCVPAGTPRAAQNRINAAVNKVIALPALQQRLANAFLTAAQPSTPEQSQAMLASEYHRFGKVIRDAGIKPTT